LGDPWVFLQVGQAGVTIGRMQHARVALAGEAEYTPVLQGRGRCGAERSMPDPHGLPNLVAEVGRVDWHGKSSVIG